MSSEIQEYQHPDSIWTWKESSRGRRQSLWLPYLVSIERRGERKGCWIFRYNGGHVEADLAKVDFIMLYGACSALPVEFLDDLNTHRIALAVHRRNLPRPYWFLPAAGADADDIVSAQIIARASIKDSAYVSRVLIRERVQCCAGVAPVSATDLKRLAATRSPDAARSIEAALANRYWAAYYAQLELPGLTRRDAPHPVNAALDAGSFFMHGVLLRWVLHHQLSPCHGFLHRQTGYPALIYDLIEPYRRWIEISVADAYLQSSDEATLTARAIGLLKSYMDETVYVPSTRQTVRRKSLLHGAVLALAAWLSGRQTRFVVPVEGEKKGGRPPKVAFSIPGYRVDN